MSRPVPHQDSDMTSQSATSSRQSSPMQIPPVRSPQLSQSAGPSATRLPSLTQLIPWSDEDPVPSFLPAASIDHTFPTQGSRPDQTFQRYPPGPAARLPPVAPVRSDLATPPPVPPLPLPGKLQVPGSRRGPVIPQRRYQPLTASDRRRYVEEVDLQTSILFNSLDSEGFPLKDALNHRYGALEAREEPMFVQHGPSISLRLNWPGYQPWTRQIPTRDFRNPPGPITRDKLTKNVAKSVQRFIEEQKSREIEPAEEQWRVGEGFIELEDLLLLRLDNVSKGSWQIQLQLAMPLESKQRRLDAASLPAMRSSQTGPAPPPRQLSWKHVGPSSSSSSMRLGGPPP
ncbi:unnamed protein product [Peniophora sp. CBMAI 1063]|nr:unnamed protein product [Peniophora sp. CBMAI 1063]